MSLGRYSAEIINFDRQSQQGDQKHRVFPFFIINGWQLNYVLLRGVLLS